jgi:hypothetical protein
MVFAKRENRTGGCHHSRNRRRRRHLRLLRSRNRPTSFCFPEKKQVSQLFISGKKSTEKCKTYLKLNSIVCNTKWENRLLFVIAFWCSIFHP